MSKKIRTLVILLIALALVAGAGYMALSTLAPELVTPRTASQQTKAREIKQADTKNIVSEEIHVPHDGIDLYGYLVAPANYKSIHLPLIIMSHGYNSNADIVSKFATLAAQRGYMVYAFDFYGGGYSTRSGNTDMLDMSVLTEKADLNAVLDYWKAQHFVDTSHIYLGGISHGGLISTLVAADRPNDVKAMVLFAPAFHITDLVKKGMQEFGYADISQVPNTVTYHEQTVGKRYITDALGIDIPAAERAYTGPVLIIHGTADTIVPFSYSQSAEKTFPHAQLMSIEGADHSMSDFVSVGSLLTLEDFMKKY
ncbi:alpha/beta hydrolase family protein [Alloscardovia omnicolens]|uniref:alpha/beta hydrolase family protein n=1 Tax=Alloscardovia omnicolens TaxID=419015 RepID=UPI003A64CD31